MRTCKYIWWRSLRRIFHLDRPSSSQDKSINRSFPVKRTYGPINMQGKQSYTHYWLIQGACASRNYITIQITPEAWAPPTAYTCTWRGRCFFSLRRLALVFLVIVHIGWKQVQPFPSPYRDGPHGGQLRCEAWGAAHCTFECRFESKLYW